MSDADRKVRLFRAASVSIRLMVLVAWGRALLGAAAALLLGATIDRAVAGEPTLTTMAVVAGLLAVRAVLAACSPPASATASARIARDLRGRVLDAVLRLGPWTGRRTGDVVGKATEGIEAVGALGGTFLPQLIGGMSVPLLLIAVVAGIDWVAALVLLAALPAVPVLLRMLERRFAAVSERYRHTADELAARFLDGIQGMRTLKAFDRARAYGDVLAQEAERLRSETMSLLRVNQLALLAVDTLFTLGTVVAAAGMAAWRTSTGAVSAGQAFTIVLLGVMLIEPLTLIGRFFYVGAIGRAAAGQVRELLEMVSPDYRPSLEMSEDGTIKLDSVSFAYPGGDQVITDATVRIARGERVAFVGPSGAGKTTLAHLVLGLLGPDTGSVRVGGRAVLVSQRPFLFHGTVAENLRLAKPSASDDELWAALDAADLSELIASRPDGLTTPVGERGLQLSGGEAQRLAIARALLVDADVVVLDEPTSNVDLLTEARVRAALDRLMVGRTVIIIAHRRSTIAGVDRVIHFHRGEVRSSDPKDLVREERP